MAIKNGKCIKSTQGVCQTYSTILKNGPYLRPFASHTGNKTKKPKEIKNQMKNKKKQYG